jgi:structure-specific recognition protein 1
MQCTNEQSELDINLDEATLEKEYGGQIQSRMTGSFSNLVAKTFKVITKKKVFIPGKFQDSNQQAYVKCALRANEGHLYPLEKQFIFIHKPAVLIRFDEIESVEFQRYAGGQGHTRNFDLNVTLHSTPGDNTSMKEYTFSGIDKTNYSALYSFLSGKKIKIKNIEEAGSEEEPSSRRVPNYNEMDEDEEEESEDEDYDQQKASGSEDSDSGDSDEDDDDMGSVVSDDSDLAEYKKKAKKAEKAGSTKKKKAKAKDSDEEGSPKKRKAGGGKKKKDPNAPKKPKSSYMYFTSAKRDEIKAANPDASFSEIVSSDISLFSIFFLLNFLVFIMFYCHICCRGSSLVKNGRNLATMTSSSTKNKPIRIRSAIRRKWRITLHRRMMMMIRTMEPARRKQSVQRKILMLQRSL